ncbi:MAG: right-handed parallel beta-helix repeat-containing protein [Actinobacteria bacterium]|nr:right-handed parallel beta-helix repeat-containing protein [Actinomycetota bacterium]
MALRSRRAMMAAAVALVLPLSAPAGAQVDGEDPSRDRRRPQEATTQPTTTTPATTTPPTTPPPTASAPEPAPVPAAPVPVAPSREAVEPVAPARAAPETLVETGPRIVVVRPAPETAVRRSPVRRTASAPPVVAQAPAVTPPAPEFPAPIVPEDTCALDRGGEEAAYHGTDPTRQLAAYSPFRVVKYPCPRAPESRAMVVAPGRIEMIQEGRLVRRLALPASAGPIPFERLARVVNDPAWIDEVEPGVFEVATAIVQEAGTSMVFAAPGVRLVRLLDRPDVFLGGRGATARFEGVSVTSWNTERGGPDEELSDGRPFVLYDLGGRLDIVDSEMSYLGSDRSGGAYGVSWRQDGITGSAINSDFHHNLFGVFTYDAADIVFRGNLFRDNLAYGFDPHDYSTRLVIEDNEAYGNGNHGFIVSRFVVDSVFRNNHAHDNDGSGIVLDFESNRNRVENNLVEDNAGDGIVVLGSADNVVVDNVIRRNRVGVRVNNLASSGNTISANRMEGNHTGLQAYGGASDLQITGNTIVDSIETGMKLDAPRSVVRGDEIRGAARGIDIRTTAQLWGVRISEVERGVTVASTGIARLEQVDVNASLQALRVDPGGLVTVDNSTLVPAPADPVARRQDPWLPLVGVSAILVAVLLELVRWKRERRDLPSPIPAEVWNRA